MPHLWRLIPQKLAAEKNPNYSGPDWQQSLPALAKYRELSYL